MLTAPGAASGSRSPLYKPTGGDGAGSATPQVGTSGTKGGSPTGSGGGGRKGKKGKFFKTNVTALNPPFDPRMRQIGSHLHQSSKMKRGFVQTDEDNLRVNFLFNPTELGLAHNIDTSIARNPDYVPTNDVLDPDYVSMGSSTSIKLLYDRTYELLGNATGNGFAHRYGVWADVAAWYVLLGMIPDMPSDWKDSMIVNPPRIKTAYLFVGPRMVYYGWLTGINVTYSHWNQRMVPLRCAVDLSMELVPHKGKRGPQVRANDAGIGGPAVADWNYSYDTGNPNAVEP